MALTLKTASHSFHKTLTYTDVLIYTDVLAYTDVRTIKLSADERSSDNVQNRSYFDYNHEALL